MVWTRYLFMQLFRITIFWRYPGIIPPITGYDLSKESNWFGSGTVMTHLLSGALTYNKWRCLAIFKTSKISVKWRTHSSGAPQNIPLYSKGLDIRKEHFSRYLINFVRNVYFWLDSIASDWNGIQKHYISRIPTGTSKISLKWRTHLSGAFREFLGRFT